MGVIRGFNSAAGERTSAFTGSNLLRELFLFPGKIISICKTVSML